MSETVNRKSGKSEHALDFVGKLTGREWLFHEVGIGCGQRLALQHALGISGKKNHLEIRTRLQQAFAQFDAVHVWHHHIADEQIDRLRLLAEKLQGILAIRGLEHGESMLTQHAADHVSHFRLIFHQQYGSALGLWHLRLPLLQVTTDSYRLHAAVALVANILFRTKTLPADRCGDWLPGY